MSDSFAQFQLTFELLINQQMAEVRATRTILQSLLVSMFANHPSGSAMIVGLKRDALATLQQAANEPHGPADVAKSQAAARFAAEQFFDDLATIFPALQGQGARDN
jgi:hypothetical protein